MRLWIILLCVPMLGCAQKQRHVKLEQYIDQGRIKKAERLSERALLKNADSGDLLLVKARLNNLKGEHATALLVADNAVQKGADPRKAMIVRGNALSGLGEYEEAIEILETIPEAERKVENTYQLALAYAGADRHEQAIATLNTLVEKDPKNYRAIRERGTSYAAMNDSVAAHADFDRAIAIAPKDPVNWNSRGFHHWARSGMHQRAIHDYDQAIKINVNYAFAFNNRGWSRYKTGDKQGAVKDIRTSQKKRPKNPFVQLNLGHIALDEGNKEKACGHFHRAKDLGFNKKYGEEVQHLLDENCASAIETIKEDGTAPTESQQVLEPNNAPTRSNAPGKN